MTQSEIEYERRMTGEVLAYRAIQMVRIQYRECDKDMVAVSLEMHQQTQNRMDAGDRYQ